MIRNGNRNFNSVLFAMFSIFTGLLFSFSVAVYADDNEGQLFVFGDSLSDPGNAFILTGMQSVAPFSLIPDAPYAIGGHHFSNGKTWVEQFAQKQEAKVKPAFRYSGGTNFAVGGSRARDVGAVNLATQVGLYVSQFSGKMNEEDLFVIFIGGNDVRDAVEAFAVDRSGISSAQIIVSALTAIEDNLTLLISAGVRNFLVANAPDLALVPAVRLQGPQAQQAANYFSVQFNQGLEQLLAAIGAAYPVGILKLDIFTLINEVVATPAEFDLKEAEDACITPAVIVDAICDNPKKYLFWDGVHPTRSGHKIIARRALALFDEDEKGRKDREFINWTGN